MTFLPKNFWDDHEPAPPAENTYDAWAEAVESWEKTFTGGVAGVLSVVRCCQLGREIPAHYNLVLPPVQVIRTIG